ncbi:GNAT family N-acetyltransferase [Yinghuangia sp. ASG 101]|uniref:bifunctional acetate--CoA ligase family protein/GNAT family N-acetyltransferase n=1 Tax=Yinghuangia sp. ASG 101 TaxID=2896848 RepID=UPI001E5D0E3B|nr:bifunctional GNAT family N-acetyltransferase/acetate--CoA ligase family protein [Yinghuangia sp. ASG 101]UGQ11698.1 GNAT family N-acetyltransferase [Yinghuangia sp. ASG 101]
MPAPPHPSAPRTEERHVLAADGTMLRLDAAGPADEPAVRTLFEGLSATSLHLRFFGMARDAVGEAAHRICAVRAPDGGALLAWHGELVVGAAEFHTTGPGEAELAVVVAEDWHHRGVGTLLIEHLMDVARAEGVRRWTADVLSDNRPMLRVLQDMGLPLHRGAEAGVVTASIPLDLPVDDPGREEFLSAMGLRERQADTASLLPLFRPTTVAVAGAGRRPDSIGRTILANLASAGWHESLFVLHPSAGEIAGFTASAHVADLPALPDTVVIAVPARSVPAVAEECGRAGVAALVVVTAGFDADQARALRQTCHRYGMRMVGPNGVGVVDTSGGTPLRADFTGVRPLPGSAGVAVQSGGVGIALLRQLNRLGIGVSTFASLGDKYDVSGNDMLQWFETDPRTALAVLHLESFGNPRKFSRIARRTGRRIPVLTVDAGRSASGRRAAASHTAAAVTPTVARGALFRQAGVTAAHSLGDLVATTALMSAQPLPKSGAVAIVGNAGGLGVLAADACADAGLTVPYLGAEIEARLRELLPSGAACGNPVDATATVPGESLRRAIDLIASTGHIGAVLLALAPTALGDPLAELTHGSAVREIPVAVVAPERAEAVDLVPAWHGAFPVFCDTRTAAAALAHARDRAMWLLRPRGIVPRLTTTDPDRARAAVDAYLAAHSGGGWLPPDACAAVLGGYGVPLAPWRRVTAADGAVDAARELRGLSPLGTVALKVSGPEITHKTDVGGVRLGLAGDDDVRAAYTDLAHRLGRRMDGAVVQPMAAPGVELIIGVDQDEVLGPLVLFGLGGTGVDILGDHSARLSPLTDLDAKDLIAESRASKPLYGHRGAPPCDVGAVEDLLHRVSRLADDLPQVCELDLNPAVAGPDGVTVVDARIRVAPRRPADPYLPRVR